jgi:hypothetical protein
MALIKILINTSGATRTVLNRELAPLEVYELPQGQWAKANDSTALYTDILNGDVTVNNGTIDLAPLLGINHINQYDIKTAEQVVFIPSPENPSTNVQDAIDVLSNGANQNFSYNKLVSGDSVIIPNNQQMIVHQELLMERGSDLLIDGDIVIFSKDN